MLCKPQWLQTPVAKRGLMRIYRQPGQGLAGLLFQARGARKGHRGYDDNPDNREWNQQTDE